jgi:hypothetical protein
MFMCLKNILKKCKNIVVQHYFNVVWSISCYRWVYKGYSKGSNSSFYHVCTLAQCCNNLLPKTNVRSTNVFEYCIILCKVSVLKFFMSSSFNSILQTTYDVFMLYFQFCTNIKHIEHIKIVVTKNNSSHYFKVVTTSLWWKHFIKLENLQ